MKRKDNKGLFSAKVLSNVQTGYCFHKIELEFEGASAQIYAKAQPGQFAQIDLSRTALPPDNRIPQDLKDSSARDIILRRPFSFANVQAKKGKTIVDILYCVVGPASLRMTTLITGDSISLLGPLGNGFWVPQGKKIALLAAGGMGSPPVEFLANTLSKNNPEIKAVAFVGAKTKDDFPFDPNKFTGKKIETIVTTDDGSLGTKGLVTQQLENWIEINERKEEEMIIYACGPHTMLERISEIANSEKIDCQVSLERRMACGIGICMGCAVECKIGGSDETIYKMCCTDGPVFEANEVVF
jgi:dihydroorotate dehydrogenase electron transfer subunit